MRYKGSMKPVARRGAVLALVAALAGCGSGAQNAPHTTVTQVEAITVDIDSTASLGVHVAGGVATLTGAVRNQAARTKTVAAAKSVSGIHEVRDELHIDPTIPNVSARVGDAALAGRIAAAIFTQTGSTAVRVNVHNGIVTLHGAVNLLGADRTYTESKTSAAFGFLPVASFAAFIPRMIDEDETQIVLEFAEWVRGLPKP